MYRSVLLSSVCFAVGCCTPLFAQCANCGSTYTNSSSVEVVSSYPVEYPVEGQYTDGAIIQDNSVGEVVYENAGNFPVEHVTGYPIENQGQVISTTSYSQQFVQQGVPVQTVSYNAAPTGMNNVLAIVNRKRRRAGLYELQFDPSLMSVAQQKSMIRANRRITGHDGSHKGGAAVEGVGYAHGYSDLNSQFNTCYLYSTGYRRAGAAIAYDNSGRAYYTLLLR